MTSDAGQPFLLGVNYWPRRKAMFWWADFDPGEVREEFAVIRDLGLTHLRIFLLWESLQRPIELPVRVRDYYRDPRRYMAELYERFGRLE